MTCNLIRGFMHKGILYSVFSTKKRSYRPIVVDMPTEIRATKSGSNVAVTLFLLNMKFMIGIPQKTDEIDSTMGYVNSAGGECSRQWFADMAVQIIKPGESPYLVWGSQYGNTAEAVVNGVKRNTLVVVANSQILWAESMNCAEQEREHAKCLFL